MLSLNFGKAPEPKCMADAAGSSVRNLEAKCFEFGKFSTRLFIQ